jgi:two-component system, cell cycle response regulator DivK
MGRILVVDDSEPERELLGYLLRARGHEVVEAGSGEESVELALDAMPNLILMDIQMPGMDGYATLDALRGSGRADLCPVLALTAFGAVGDREKALAAGFDAYFSKPITPATFMDQLEAFLDREDEPMEGSPRPS